MDGMMTRCVARAPEAIGDEAVPDTALRLSDLRKNRAGRVVIPTGLERMSITRFGQRPADADRD